MTQFISEQVDIYQLPELDTKYAKADAEITIGDLHGNSMKLMFMLVKHGIAKGLSDKDYADLVEIYKLKSSDITKNHLSRFKKILDKIKFSQDKGIRLIGDELADRGSNDYFTLKILEKLRLNQVPFEIMISNHSVEFLQVAESKKDFKPVMLHPQHASSLYALDHLVEKGLVKRDEILAINDKVYKPSLKVIGYTLSESEQEITIHSHAGIGLNNIRDLANLFNIKYKDNEMKDLANTIDQINHAFQNHLEKKELGKLLNADAMLQGYTGFADPKHPLVYAMWNRDYSQLERPEKKGNYRIKFCHGHDSAEMTNDNIYVLDGHLGKTEYLNQGEYKVLHHPRNSIGQTHKVGPSAFKEQVIQGLAEQLENLFDLDANEQSVDELKKFDGQISTVVKEHFIKALSDIDKTLKDIDSFAENKPEAQQQALHQFINTTREQLTQWIQHEIRWDELTQGVKQSMAKAQKSAIQDFKDWNILARAFMTVINTLASLIGQEPVFQSEGYQKLNLFNQKIQGAQEKAEELEPEEVDKPQMK